MKAVFVIDDIPNELDVNDLLIDYCVHTKGEYKTIRKGGNHPLKPLPQHREMFVGDRDRREVMLWKAYYKGWNDCIDAIEGETE